MVAYYHAAGGNHALDHGHTVPIGRPRFTPLTADESKAILKAARPDLLYPLYAVALAVGIRWGEALGLRRRRDAVDKLGFLFDE
jgi:integrase